MPVCAVGEDAYGFDNDAAVYGPAVSVDDTEDVPTVTVIPDVEALPEGDAAALESVSGAGAVVVDTSTPIPVQVIEEDVSYPSLYAAGSGIDLVLDDTPPENPPFYGSCFVTGTTSSGNTVTLYFPVNYRTGYFGVDADGYLFSINSASVSGYYAGAYNNSVNVPGFSYPRYRAGSGYDYTDLYISPVSTNMEIATGFEGQVTVEDMLPYVMILLLGVIMLCCMKRS